jgi:TetR/AcrR family transcriptional regulator
MQRALQRAGRERDASGPSGAGPSGRRPAREAILDAAQEIFARDGFSGARVDDIAHRAGYNKALIFHYFEDKLGLYRALMLRTKRHLIARFEERFDRLFADDARVTAERIRALVAECLDVLFDLSAQHPEAGRIMAWEAAEGWQTYVGCALPATDAWSRRVEALIERAQAAGIVRADLDPRLLFTTLISLPLMHLISLPRFAAMFPATDFTSPAALAHAREQMTELVLRGIFSPTAILDDEHTATHEASHLDPSGHTHPTEEA